MSEIYKAIENGDIKVIQKALDNGMSINETLGCPLLHHAVSANTTLRRVRLI